MSATVMAAEGRLAAMRFSAIRVHAFGDPSVLKLEHDVSLPMQALKGDQVLIRHRAAGVNPIDTYFRSGMLASSSGTASDVPYTPGLDGAGVIEQVGADVTSFKAGDRVAFDASITGGYAQYGVCNQSSLIRLPDAISFEQGASVGVPFLTAYHALFGSGMAKPGQNVLIHGASGGVGTAAVQLARGRGLNVFGTAGSARGREIVSSLGAHHVFDHTAPGYTEQIIKAAGPSGINLIVEMAAHINLAADLNIIARRGRIVVIGSRGDISISPRAIMSKETTVTGMRLFTIDPEDLATARREIEKLLADGSVLPVVAKTFSLAEAAKAHEDVYVEGKSGKSVLKID